MGWSLESRITWSAPRAESPCLSGDRLELGQTVEFSANICHPTRDDHSPAACGATSVSRFHHSYHAQRTACLLAGGRVAYRARAASPGRAVSRTLRRYGSWLAGLVRLVMPVKPIEPIRPVSGRKGAGCSLRVYWRHPARHNCVHGGNNPPNAEHRDSHATLLNFRG